MQEITKLQMHLFTMQRYRLTGIAQVFSLWNVDERMMQWNSPIIILQRCA